MARKPTGNPVGPPEKPIDWIQFEQLCALQCTQSEIASMFKVHKDTIRSRVELQYGDDYSTVYKKYSESGLCSLRRNQFVLSKKNAAMAIWLGKQWLGQKDHEEKHPPNDKAIDQTIVDIKILGSLLDQNKKLQDELDALKRKTTPEFCTSDSSL